MGNARRRAGLAVGGWAIVAAVAVASCGSGAGGAGSGAADGSVSSTTPPLVTTPPDPAAAAALSQPGTHALPRPKLPGTAPPQNLRYYQLGEQVLAWGAASYGAPRDGGNIDPIDVGATLDPTTLSWTTLPPTPFRFPTAFPQVVPLDADRFAVVGNGCDERGTHTVETGTFDCQPGAIQAATFDLRTRRWRTASAPPIEGEVSQGFASGGRVLVQYSKLSEIGSHFLLLDAAAGTWTRVADPATGDPDVVCSSHDIAFAINVRVATASGWIELDQTSSRGGDDRYGQVQVSALGPGDAGWSTPSSAAPLALAPNLVSGCVSSAVLVTVPGVPSLRVAPAAVLWTPGGGWAAAAAPPSALAAFEVGPSAATPIGQDEVVVQSGVGSLQAAFDGTTRSWTVQPLTADLPLGVHVGPAELNSPDGSLGPDAPMVATTP